MQDDPLSEFSSSVHLSAEGSAKPQKREKKILVFEDAKLHIAKFTYLSLSIWVSENAFN